MSEPKSGPAYRILTPRLVIRCYNPGDGILVDQAIKDNLDHLRKWIIWATGEPVTIHERIQYLRQCRASFDLDKDYTYGIFNLDESAFIGGTGLHTRLGPDAREIGYWIHKDFTRQGFATEVASALTKVAFEIDHVSRVEIHCDPRNTYSAAIPKKLGFTHEATLHNRHEGTDGNLRDAMIWTLFRENYPASPSSKIHISAFDAIGQQIL